MIMKVEASVEAQVKKITGVMGIEVLIVSAEASHVKWGTRNFLICFIFYYYDTCSNGTLNKVWIWQILFYLVFGSFLSFSNCFLKIFFVLIFIT